MQPNTKPNLYTLLTDKPQSTTHLQQPNFLQFVKLCLNHQQIASNFGVGKLCKRSCLVCPGCQKHKDEGSGKHGYMDLGRLSKTIKQIKSKYQQYHRLYIEELIPKFLNNLKNITLDFMRALDSYNEQTVLLSSFAGSARQKKIYGLLLNDVKDWDLSEITCAELAELQGLRDRVLGKTDQEFVEGIGEELKGLLGKSLIAYGLLPQHYMESKRVRQQEIIHGNTDQISTRLKQLQAQIQVQSQPQQKPWKTPETLSIQLQSSQPNTENEQQHNEKLGSMIEELLAYAERGHHRNLVLNFMGESENLEFWEFLVQRLGGFGRAAGSGLGGRVQQIVIQCSNPKELFDRFRKQAGTGKPSPQTPNLQDNSPSIPNLNLNQNLKLKLTHYNIEFTFVQKSLS